MTAPLRAVLTVGTLALLAALAPGHDSSARTGGGATAAARVQSTLLVSRARGGGLPNGASTNAVISGDRRFVRAIAFESAASNLVRGDRNGKKDVFVVTRGNHPNNRGTRWKPGRNILISRSRSGRSGNGPSYSPSIGGGFDTPPRCVGFLSAASNLVRGDRDRQPDAFLARVHGGGLVRLRARGRQPRGPATAVAVSGDCSHIVFIKGGKLYLSKGGAPASRVRTPAHPADPSFATGRPNSFVFGARGGIYLSRHGERPHRVARGGRNPAYQSLHGDPHPGAGWPTLAYERKIHGHWQIVRRRLGRREQVLTRGNGESHNPVLGNKGFYVVFESDAEDDSGQVNVFLYTKVRDLTLLESVRNEGTSFPGASRNPSMSYYANYIVFDATGRTSSGAAGRQIYMRYLGGV